MDRKRDVLCGWAIVPAWGENVNAYRRPFHFSRARADELRRIRDAEYRADAPHRIVRVEITITEEATDDET